MNMRSIAILYSERAASYSNIWDSHKVTCPEGIQIGTVCSYVSPGCCDSVYMDDSFLMESQSPEKRKKVIRTRVTVDEYVGYCFDIGIYHTSRILYFFVICKGISWDFLFMLQLHNMRIKTPRVIAISAILKTAKYRTLIKSVTNQETLRSSVFNDHPVRMRIYQIFSFSDIFRHICIT